MPTYSKTHSQAGQQIASDFTWNGYGVLGNPANVTYAFRATKATYPDSGHNEDGTFTKFNAAQITATELALSLWSDVANITFTRVGSGNDVKSATTYSDNASILFGNYKNANDGSGAFAWLPPNKSSFDQDGDVWVNSQHSANLSPDVGSYGFITLLHELGHAIGLYHPGSYNAGPGVSITYENNAEYIEDSRQYTVMSYFDAAKTGADHGSGSTKLYAATPLIDDIAAAQILYGANTTTRTGDTIYGFNSNADRDAFTITSATEKVVFAVWDAGGLDTFDFSGYSTASTIDIRNGAFSSVGGLKYNIGIAIDLKNKDELIENAIGGFGADTIQGNKEDNTLVGNDGNDKLYGGAGVDVIDGGAGDDIIFVNDDEALYDTIKGGEGTDTIQVIGDSISFPHITFVNFDAAAMSIEVLDGGNVTFYGTQGDNVLDFSAIHSATRLPWINGMGGDDTIIGTAVADNLFGHAGADTLRGGAGNDILQGGGGADILNGGAGDDTILSDFEIGVISDVMDGGDGVDTFKLTSSVQFLNFESLLTSIERLDGNGYRVEGTNADNVFDLSKFLSVSNLVLIDGLAGNDTIKGSSGSDNIFGGAGNDKLLGGSGNDVLVGGAGDDILDGGDPNGTDTVSYGSVTSGVQVNLSIEGTHNAYGSGLDTLINIDAVIGTNYADVLTAGTKWARLNGGAGADMLNAGKTGLGSEYIGGANDGALGDTVSYWSASTGLSIVLDFGTTERGVKGARDLLSEIENIIGSQFDDIIVGNSGNNTIEGVDGDDLIYGGNGADNLDGGDGIDTLDYRNESSGFVINLSSSYVSGSGEAKGDTILNFENVIGGYGADVLFGSELRNILEGRDGNDKLNAGDEDDTLIGGIGNDILTGGAGLDLYIFGFNSDDDTIEDFSIADGDIITLTSFSFLQSVADMFARGIISENGSDTKIDFNGEDTLLLKGIAASSLDDGQFEFALPTDIIGTSGKDTINGTQTAPGQVFASNGEENIFGLEGDDNINALGGFDVVDGGAGNDKLAGGDGIDTVTYISATAAVLVTLASTAAQDTKGAGKDTISQFENLEGSDFADKLTGDAKDNELFGGEGDDYLDATAGNDKLFGGSEDDILIGGTGSDVLNGGTESVAGDTASYAGIAVAVSANLAGGAASYKIGTITDTDGLIDIENLIGGSAGDNLSGDDQNNRLDGSAGNDTLNGGGGNDILNGGAGADALDGGDDSDTVSYSSSTVAVTVVMDGVTASKGGDAAGDTLLLIENLIGSAKDDKLTGNADKNTIDGGGGNDLIEGGDEADRLFGRAGIDTLSYALSMLGVLIFLIEQGTFDIDGDAIEGIAQTGGDAQGDLIWGFENVTGSNFADVIEGDGLANIILAGGEDDKVSGLGGKDTLDGGAGIDTLDLSYLGSGQNVTATLGALNTKTGAVAKTSTSGVVGDIDSITNFENVASGDGDDKFIGNAGANVLDGGGGNDTLFGMAGNDTLNGGNGNDMLEGGLGDDTLDGGADKDTASYATATVGVSVDLTKQGAPQDTLGAGNDTLNNVENLIGSAKNDNFRGDEFANVIEGGLGDDTLDGGNIVADDDDTLSYAGATAAVTVSLDIAGEQKTGGGGNDTVSGFEHLIGGKGNDKLTGGDLTANEIYGGLGNDAIKGLGGDDDLDGGAGVDNIDGGEGNDTIYIGGLDAQSDLINGGSGTDRIVVSDKTTSVVISGFGPGNSIEEWEGNDADVIGTSAANVLDFRGLTLVSGMGNIDGGAGNDTIIDSASGNIIHGGAGNDTLIGDHWLYGDAGNDTLTGSGTLDGGAGNDVLNSTGSTWLIGGAGADIINGDESSGDTIEISGNEGVGDIINAGSGGVDELSFGGGLPIVLSNFDAKASGIERLETNGLEFVVGTAAGDNIDFSGFNRVDGSAGTFADPDDGVTIDGLGGNDKLTGTFVYDKIFGGAGNDVLNGKGSEDHLYGGAGTDTLTGGADADTFHIKWGEGADTITDFVRGEDLIEVDLPAAMPVPTTLVQASGPGMPAYTGTNPAIIYDQNDGKVYYDSGPGAPVLIVTLSNVPTFLNGPDFVFI